TGVAAGLIFALALFAVVWGLARREWAPVLVLAPAALTEAVLGPTVTPYANGKLLAVLTPAVLFCAAPGLAWLPKRTRPLSYAMACALTAAVLVSDALSYHHDK